jgi:hypothetical protein
VYKVAAQNIAAHLSSASGAIIQFTDQGSKDWGLGIADGTSALTFFEDRNVSAAGTARMTIASGGNVGIGTAAPILGLTIKNDTGSTTYGQRAGSLVLESNNTTGGGGTDVVWSTGTETNKRYASIGTALVGNDGASGSRGNIVFATKAASATTTLTERMSIATSGTVNVVGTFTAGTKTFRIDHPLPEKTDTHYLLHSSIEGPKADLIYRGRANLVSGTVDVNIDIAAGMTDGTFEVLCDDVQCFTSNEDGWTALKGSVTGNILTITAQDNTCTDIVSWLVIGERKDAKMIESEWADADGKLIVEALKSEHE